MAHLDSVPLLTRDLRQARLASLREPHKGMISLRELQSAARGRSTVERALSLLLSFHIMKISNLDGRLAS
jgi:hypothetical protein